MRTITTVKDFLDYLDSIGHPKKILLGKKNFWELWYNCPRSQQFMYGSGPAMNFLATSVYCKDWPKERPDEVDLSEKITFELQH
jgi:hypothetical protein